MRPFSEPSWRLCLQKANATRSFMVDIDDLADVTDLIDITAEDGDKMDIDSKSPSAREPTPCAGRYFASFPELQELAKAIKAKQIQPYNVLVLDPPWEGGLHVKYATMGYKKLVAALKPLLKQICAPDAIVFIWYFGTHVAQMARDLRDELGLFTRRDDWLVWGKINNQVEKKLVGGQTPYIRSNTEYLMLTSCSESAPKLHNVGNNSLQLEPRPGGHSRKPDIFRKMIRKMCGPEKRYLEMFARYRRNGKWIAKYTKGWDWFGDEKW